MRKGAFWKNATTEKQPGIAAGLLAYDLTFSS